MPTIEQLLQVEEVSTADESFIKLEDITPILDLIEELDHTDILYKLSAIAATFLTSLIKKATSIKLLEIADDEVDSYFTETEKGFIYGCYLISSTIPEEKRLPSVSVNIPNEDN